MFDTAFVNPNHISRIPELCEEDSELRFVYITPDVPVCVTFNAAYWPERTLRIIAELVNKDE